jgi:hypothetical protein
MPGSPKKSLSLSFPHQYPVYTSLLHHTHHMPLYSITQTRLGGKQIIKLLIRYLVCYLLGVSPASGLYWPTFRNILSVPSSRQMIWKWCRPCDSVIFIHENCKWIRIVSQ